MALLCLLLSGCAYDSFNYPDEYGAASSSEKSSIPVSGIYRVQSGDTLFSIAFSYGLDYRQLADINNIVSPYVIYPHQKIRLTGTSKSNAATVSSNSSSVKSTSVTSKVTSSTPVTKSATTKVNVPRKKQSTVNVQEQKVASWQWPINGNVIKSFSKSGVSSKGIDIKGTNAELVKAAADGVVVYAGDGLIGYGNLVIVKHNDVYLSAYAYNERILVKEKQSVRSGDSLAVIGGKGADRPVLHFEVRRDGQPIDPINVLPKK